jgi:hypothetical protein
MKEELRSALSEIAAHPATYGVFAALARWAIGDRTGGWRALLGYLASSLLVAWAGSLYLADEAYTSARAGFFLIVLCFVAKDLLVALAGIAQQFRLDPWSVVDRIRQALRGGPSQ